MERVGGHLPPPLTGSRGAGREAEQESRFAGAAEAKARAARIASLLRSILTGCGMECMSSMPRRVLPGESRRLRVLFGSTNKSKYDQRRTICEVSTLY